MPDAFDRFEGKDAAKGDAFDRFPVQKESFGKAALRTAYQIPSGVAQAKTYPLDLLQMAGVGHALDEEEIEHLRKIYEREKIPFDEDEYRQQVQNAADYFPTQGNAERIIEEETGAPLTAKTRGQKFLKFASTASKIAPKDYTFRGMNTSLPRPVLGTGVAAASEVGKELGVPEPIADIASFAILKKPTEGAGKVSVSKAKKPSGLTERRYEKLTEPKEVSAKKVEKINEKVESEFRDIANNIIKKSPIEETHSALKNDSTFKSQASAAFKDVEKVSEQLPQKFSTEKVGKKLVKIAFEKKGTGFTPSEYDHSHKKFIKQFLQETPKQDIQAKDLVTQFRKNNEALKEAYEPGQSFAYNRGKRQALTDYNKAIVSLIEEEFPDSEFSNLFKSTNKQWSQIMDAEAIDKFMDKLFDGKIRFEKGRQFFDKEGMTIPFKRALGEEGFKDFEQLMTDLMSTEQGNRMLKAAKTKGFKDLADIGLGYILHPAIAKTQIIGKSAKLIHRKIFEALLDKPQLAVTWDKGLKAFKKGDFKTAEQSFNKLKAEVEVLPKEAEKAIETPKSAIEEPIDVTPKKISAKELEGKEEIKLLEAPKKQLEFKENVKNKKVENTPVYDLTFEEAEKNLNEIHKFERDIIEPKVGKEIYEGLYEKQGFEGQRKFWDKYADKFTDKELDLLEKIPYSPEQLRSRLNDLREIRTSYNIGETRKESINQVIKEIRNPLINSQKPENRALIRDAFEFLKKKGHEKNEIAKEIFEVIKTDLSSSDAEYILEDLFNKKPSVELYKNLDNKIRMNIEKFINMDLKENQEIVKKIINEGLEKGFSKEEIKNEIMKEIFKYQGIPDTDSMKEYYKYLFGKLFK